MVKVRHNLKGQRFGKLVVLEQCEDWVSPTNKKHVTQWLCQCDCGNQCKVTTNDLTSKNKQSCNCLHYETIAERHKYNKYDLSGEYGIGYLADGSEFYFDLDNYDLIKDYRWSKNNGYIVCYKVKNGKKYRVHLHRLIMGLDNEDERVVDHINLKRNDNRKENLRICTYSQNSYNKKSRSKLYKGITYKKREGTYRAVITAEKHTYYLGDYTTLEEAIKARKDAEVIYHGEFRYKEN